MNDIEIKTLCEQIVTGNGFLYIDTVVRGTRSIRVIEVYMDSPSTLSIDECALVSRAIDEALTEADPSANFRLDVSSPGTGRPLKFLEQYPKNIGRDFEIQFLDGSDKRKRTGKLTAVEGRELRFTAKNNEEFIIIFDKILSAKVLISFS